MSRALILVSLTLILLGVAGVSGARERTSGPERHGRPQDAAQKATGGGSGPLEAGGRAVPTPARTVVDRPATGRQFGAGKEAAGFPRENFRKPENAGQKGDGDVVPRVRPADVGKLAEAGGPDRAGELQGSSRNFRSAGGVSVGGGYGPAGRAVNAGVEVRSEGKAEDGRGMGRQKATLCHKGKNTITVGAPAKAAHLRHGDDLGACGW